MRPKTTAGILLHKLSRDGEQLLEPLAAAAGVDIDRLRRAKEDAERLTVSEQLRLADAVLAQAPAFRRPALHLRGQALAAHSFETDGASVRHAAPPPTRRL